MKVAVVIGRFHPFQEVHASILESAFLESDQVIVVLEPSSVVGRTSIVCDWYCTRPYFTTTTAPVFINAPEMLDGKLWSSEIIKKVHDLMNSVEDYTIKLYEEKDTVEVEHSQDYKF